MAYAPQSSQDCFVFAQEWRFVWIWPLEHLSYAIFIDLLLYDDVYLRWNRWKWAILTIEKWVSVTWGEWQLQVRIKKMKIEGGLWEKYIRARWPSQCQIGKSSLGIQSTFPFSIVWSWRQTNPTLVALKTRLLCLFRSTMHESAVSRIVQKMLARSQFYIPTIYI